jgi:hypothetical protein
MQGITDDTYCTCPCIFRKYGYLAFWSRPPVVCMPRRTLDGFHWVSHFSSFFSEMLSLPPLC